MNQHQWPKVLIICDEPYNEELSEVGLATGRMLASHGLKILVSVGMEKKSTRKSTELQLLRGCKNVKLVNTSFSGQLLFNLMKEKIEFGTLVSSF